MEQKSPEIEAMLEVLNQAAHGRSRKDSMSSGFCVSCGNPAVEFKNELSRKEYGISGMCQKCQDEFFVEED